MDRSLLLGNSDYFSVIGLVNLTYVLLSPAFGMAQYTAGLANRQPNHQVTVLAPDTVQPDRFAPAVCLQRAWEVRSTGLHRSNLNPASLCLAYRQILATRPDGVHFTAPHLWNPLLLLALRRAGIPTVHTVHDLDPHSGAGYGRLLYPWNWLVLRLAGHILVHSSAARARLIAQGMAPGRVTHTPLLHLFLSHANEQRLSQARLSAPCANGPILFFARIEAYKGVGVLVAAMRQLQAEQPDVTAIIAGKGDIGAVAPGALPGNIEVRNHLIEDDEAIELFTRCSLVVLPYVDASQSALVAAAYFFGKPVIVTRAGALPEYVIEGQTGWVIPPRDAPALAACMRTALSDPLLLARMGQAGRAWFDAQQIQERATLQTLYERVRAL